MKDDKFKLHNLEVRVVGNSKKFACGHKLGVAFSVVGEDLIFEENQRFSMYSLAAITPLLPAKQRTNHPNDWIESNNEVDCPDPKCKAIFQINRVGRTSFSHKDVTKQGKDE